MQSFDERYPAEPDSVARARRDLAAFAATAGAGEAQVQAVRLAVSEAVTNAVLHGYRGQPGDVRVTARIGPRGLSIVVRDAGAGLQPCAERPGLGYGLALIVELADAMSIRQAMAGGTELWMRFSLAAQPAVAAAA